MVFNHLAFFFTTKMMKDHMIIINDPMRQKRSSTVHNREVKDDESLDEIMDPSETRRWHERSYRWGQRPRDSLNMESAFQELTVP